MSARIDNCFTQYEFTEQEAHDAAILNPLQLQYFQTEAANCANELLLLEPDPANPTKFMLEREYIRGKLQQIQWFIETSNNIKTALDQALEEQKIFKQAQEQAAAATQHLRSGE